jgi:DHA1 family bicyclomycin/chloramphenicol resistance-like MFS transporter
MFAPTLGGYLAEFFGWRWIFGCCALLGLAVLVFSWLRIAETHPPRGSAHPKVRISRSYRTLLTSPDYLAFVCYGSFMTAAMYTVITNGPYVVIDVMHMGPSTYGNLFLFPALGSFCGFFSAARIGRRFGAFRLMQTGLTLGLIATTVMTVLITLHFWHPVVFFLPAMVLGFANALSTPSSTSSAIGIHPEIAGAASGVLGFSNLAFSAATTQLAANLANHTPIPFTWMVLAQVLAAGAVFLYIRRRKAQPTASPEYDGSETMTL